MLRSVRYHPLFESDVIAAAQWYDARQLGLGTDFVKWVRFATSALIDDPERRTAVDFGLRYWPILRFPYVVFYDFTDLELLVLGVMHTAQESYKWRERRGLQ